jgi:putative ABC transport system permease protein
MDTLKQDLAFALRTLRRSPGFAITAIVTIALGIGATTAIFSAVNGVLLRPLPYADPERLVFVWSDLRVRNVTDFPVMPGDFGDLRQQGTLFAGLANLTTQRAPLSGDVGEPEQIRIASATSNIFDVLGVDVVLGRNFTDEDGAPLAPPPQPPQAAPGQPPVQQAGPPPAPPPPPRAILSHEFWSRRYGADSTILGRTLNVGGGQVMVVGVLEPGVEILTPPTSGQERRPDLWTSVRIQFNDASRINYFLRVVVGRLKPGVTVEQARAQVTQISDELIQRFPNKVTSGNHLRLEPMHQDVVADVRPALLALLGAVGFVLLIACANVANLMLVRLADRERELAVRAALGAGRGTLVRQLLTEAAIIAGAGAILGVGLAWVGTRVLVALAPANLPRTDVIALDPTVLAFTAGMAILAAALFGIVPALRAARPDLMQPLRSSGRTSALGGGALVRRTVAVVEVALSFVLLVGCGLMVRSFIELNRARPGYRPEGVLTLVVQNPRLPTPPAREAFKRQLRERFVAIPGVQAATAASSLPLDGTVSSVRWGTETALTDESTFQQADYRVILPGFFQAMGTRVLAGREFTEQESRDGGNIIMIDERLAQMAFPGRSPVGERLLVRARTQVPEWHEVIGVVEHQRKISPATDSDETIYVPDGYAGHGPANRWAIRTAGDPAALAPAVRAALKEIDPLIPAAEVQAMSVLVTRAMAPTRFALALITGFAVIAAMLAAVGLYGVLSTGVRQRTAEIGVRMVFGAPKGRIFALVIGEGLRLGIIGVVVGLAGAFALTRIMSGMLIGVTPTDPVTFATMAVVFVAIAGIACWLPARRAAGLDPAVALRES